MVYCVTVLNLRMKFSFLFLKIVLSTSRQTVKTLIKSRSLLFAKVHDKERVEAQNGTFANSADQ